MQEKNGSSSDSSDTEHLHTIFQLANKSVITIEVDSGAERSTVSLSVFEQKLADVCKLQPSAVTLHQYDKTPLTIFLENVKLQLKLVIMLSKQSL